MMSKHQPTRPATSFRLLLVSICCRSIVRHLQKPATMNHFKCISLMFLSLFYLMIQAKNITTTTDTLTSREFNDIINKQFSNLITGRITNTIGNFAALDIEKTKVNFAANHIQKNGNVFALNASGGISDGFFNIFNNSELNTNVSLDLQYHFINRKKRLKIVYDYFQNKELKNKENEIKEIYSKDSLFIANKHERNILLMDNFRLESLKDKLGGKRASLINNRISINNNDSLSIVNAYIDSLDYEISLIDLKTKSINNKLKVISDTTWIDDNKLEIGNKRADALDRVDRRNLDIKGFRFAWLSIGYMVRRDVFKIFNSSLDFSNQIRNENFISHEFRIQYSIYHWSDDYFKTYFVSGGISYGYKNNISDLNKTEISEVTNYGVNVNDRTTTETYTAYVGEYINGQNQLNGCADLYYFLFSKNQVGVHFYPQVRLTKGQKPIYSIGFGLLFPFKDKKNEKSIVNAEIYYNWVDISKSTENSYNLFKRNNIGLRFAFPINFNPERN
jgi:hypothetical protein